MRISLYAPGKLEIMDSYGQIACELGRHLARLGAAVSLIPAGDRITPSMDDELRALASRPIDGNLGGIVLGYPTGYAGYGSLSRRGPRIAVTMFETTRIPDGWADALNECAAVVVPTTFCADVFRACGVTAPVHVIPLGIGEVYRPGPRDPDPDRPLTFLAFEDRGRRKGGFDALTAFHRAFGDDLAYRLVLKKRPRPGQTHTCDNPNVENVRQDMTPAELRDLYLRCDVLINPNRGEGFGLIPREAVFCECIALATGWGGTADDIDLWGWPLPYRLEPCPFLSKRLVGQDLGMWAEPDIDGMVDILRDVAARRDWYREQAIQKARNARALYSWEKFAQKVLEVYESVSKTEMSPSKAMEVA